MLWHPMAVLPNVEIGESIEAPNAAFVAAHDARIKEINDKHSNFALFLESFADAFGETLTPSILLLHPTTALNFMTVGSVASLRDILSVSVIPRARSRAIQGLPLSSVAYSNSFDFYPWMLDRNYRHLIAITPAILALDEVRKFKGQPSPEVNRKTIGKSALDVPLFNELSRRWNSCYSRLRPKWRDLALMRSLNMAYHASGLSHSNCG